MVVSLWQRRPLSFRHRSGVTQWLAEHAWRLSGITGAVSAIAFCTSATISFFLRQRKPYVFPLISDLASYDPERTILYYGFVVSTVFLILTTVACRKRALMLNDGKSAESVEDNDLARIDEGNGTGRRRRILGVTSVIVVTLGLLIIGSFIRSIEMMHAVGDVFTAERIDTILTFGIALLWFTAVSYLTWFFFKLETIPSQDPCALQSEETNYGESELHGNHVQPACRQRFHSLFLKFVLFLRPFCFVGQVVCLIKIAGLRLALNRFTASRIHYIRLLLHAALAFTEYTAVFFFSFFMIMLMIDIRNKFRPGREFSDLPITVADLGSPMLGSPMLGSPMLVRSPNCR